MKRKRHTPEEIIKKLREAATLLAGGQSVEAVCKKLEVSPPTYHRWRQEYAGAKEDTMKRLKELEKENGRLNPKTASSFAATTGRSSWPWPCRNGSRGGSPTRQPPYSLPPPRRIQDALPQARKPVAERL